jgi:hypothetical protein
MMVTMAYIRGDDRVCIRSLLDAETPSQKKIVPIDDLPQENVTLFLYSKDNWEEVSGQFQNHYPLSLFCEASASPLNFSSYDDFFDADDTQLKKFCEERLSKWILSNNLKTAENLFPTLKGLGQLWWQERQSFFQELWALLKRNLGGGDFKIFYHDLDLNEKEIEKMDKADKAEKGEEQKFEEGKAATTPNQSTPLHKYKDKITLFACAGESFPPTVRKAVEGEIKTFEAFVPRCMRPLDFIHFSPEKEELVFLSQMAGTSILFMLKSNQLTQLQRIAVKLIFEGLDQTLNFESELKAQTKQRRTATLIETQH